MYYSTRAAHVLWPLLSWPKEALEWGIELEQNSQESLFCLKEKEKKIKPPEAVS